MIINGFHYGFIQISMFINENQLNIADVSNIFTFTPTVSVCLSVCPSVRSSGLSLSIVCYLLQLRYLASLCWFINTYFFPFLCAAFPLWKGVSSTAQTYQRNSRHFSNSRLRVFIKESFLQPSVLGSSWVFFLLAVSVSMNHFTFEHFQFSFDLPLVEFLVRADLWQRPTIVVFAMAAKGIDAALCCQLV